MSGQYPSSIVNQRGILVAARRPHVLDGRRKSGCPPARPAERPTMPNKANCPRPQRREPGVWRHAGPLRQTKPIPSGETGWPCEGGRVKQSQFREARSRPCGQPRQKPRAEDAKQSQFRSRPLPGHNPGAPNKPNLPEPG